MRRNKLRRRYYGLMAGGRAGADRAIKILSGDIVRTMKLLGAHTIEQLKPKQVARLRRHAPR